MISAKEANHKFAVETKLLTDKETINYIVKRNKTFGEKIVNGINRMIRRKIGSKEQKFLAGIRTKWEAALEESRKEGDKKEPSEDGKVAYAIYETVNGEKFVVLDQHQGLFAGIEETDYSKIVKEFFEAELSGKRIPVSEYESILVDKTGIKKNLYSGKNESNRAVKLKASIELDELLLASEYLRHDIDHKNHSFAKDGFDYYRSVFIVDGKVFECQIDIGYDATKGGTFYLIDNVKNITSSNYGEYLSHLLRPHSSVSTGSDSKHSISDSAEKDNRKFSIGKETEREYMAAVERGDMETAQRMVDQAAKAAGYDTQKLYHGTPDRRKRDNTGEIVPNEDWNVFDPNKSNADRIDGSALFFTDNKAIAEFYAPRKDNKNSKVFEVYLKKGKMLTVEGNGADWNRIKIPSELPKRKYRGMKVMEYSDTADTSYICKKAKEAGYDSVYFKNIVDGIANNKDMLGDVYAVFDSSQVKSADAVTYDDAGNIIPLSERFDVGDADIRYAFGKENHRVSKADVSYEALIRKPDMAVTEITEPVPVLENGKVNKTALIKAGKNSVRWLNNPANNDKQQFVRIKDIDTDVLVNTKSLEHGRRHPKSVNDTFEVYPHIGKILENSIVVNELNSRGNEKFSYITLGVAKKGNDFYFVRATINVLNENLAEAEEIEVYDKLKGIVAHKETASGLGSPLPLETNNLPRMLLI